MKRAVHLVGRDVQKTKLPAILRSEFCQIGPGGLEQTEGPVDIGANEGLGAGKRTVHVALSREMQDGARLIPVEQTVEQRAGRRCPPVRNGRRNAARSK